MSFFLKHALFHMYDFNKSSIRGMQKDEDLGLGHTFKQLTICGPLKSFPGLE